jgi:demethylmenaquinone methyltransferase/2-methoxy-6-polyprenyl-1,4-benzoquinol methylase
MFARIARRYDLMNTLMTFGQDRFWRQQVVGMASIPAGGSLLDIGTGTGDIAFEALRQRPAAHVTGADFTREMIDIGRRRPGGETVQWCLADALHLPFPDTTFDAVTSGYLVRNVPDVRLAFREQVRVVKPGGRVVCLDTSPPPRGLSWPFVWIYLKVIIPALGYLVARDMAAYRYLPDSTRAFVNPDQLTSVMRDAGLRHVNYRRFMSGTQVICTGIRPQEPPP